MNIYDFDKTIYDGDSSIDFFKFCLKKNKKVLITLPYILGGMLLYLLNFKEKEYFKSAFFSFLKYFDNIDREVKLFWKQNDYKIKEFYKKNHKNTDIIISASPEFLLTFIAKQEHFKLIASKVDKKTGKFIDNNCYGEEKVNKLHNIGITKCVEFYSDSLSDSYVAKLADKAYIVRNDKIILWNEYRPSKTNKIKHFILDRNFITFLFIGLINVINGIWIAFVYSLFVKNSIVAYMLGFITSMSISYLLNSLLNFKSKLSFKKYYKFSLNNIPNFIIQIITVYLFIKVLECNKLLSYTVSSVIAVPITFILVKTKVFGKVS